MEWVKGAGAIAGLVATIVTLVFLFRPDLQPKPPPSASSGALKLLEFYPNASLRAFLEQTDQSTEGFTSEQLASRVAFMLYEVKLQGFEDKPIIVKQELIDNATNEELSDERPFTITPPQNSVKRNWHYSVPLSMIRGNARMVVTLLDGDVDVARLKSRPFAGLKPG